MERKPLEHSQLRTFSRSERYQVETYHRGDPDPSPKLDRLEMCFSDENGKR